jgi:hypothetical protein
MQPYQEGDIASFPVTPHADGVTALRHADSALRLGEMPENANQKDFIRRGHSLHVDPERELRAHVSRRGKGAPTRTFGTAFSEHSHEAARKLRAEIRRGVASGAIVRAGGAGVAAEAEAEAGAEAEAASPFSLVTGPRAHAEVVLESEAIRGNLSGATELSRMLANRAGAPTSAAPAPEHHFYFGGSRAQKRRAARRAENMAKAREANLAMRKEELLRGNVEELERLAQDFEEQRAAELEALRAAEAARAMREKQLYEEDRAGDVFGEAGSASPSSPGSASPSAGPASYSTPLAWGVLGVFAVLLAGVGIYGMRKAKGRRANR